MHEKADWFGSPEPSSEGSEDDPEDSKPAAGGAFEPTKDPQKDQPTSGGPPQSDSPESAPGGDAPLSEEVELSQSAPGGGLLPREKKAGFLSLDTAKVWGEPTLEHSAEPSADVLVSQPHGGGGPRSEGSGKQEDAGNDAAEIPKSRSGDSSSSSSSSNLNQAEQEASGQLQSPWAGKTIANILGLLRTSPAHGRLPPYIEHTPRSATMAGGEPPTVDALAGGDTPQGDALEEARQYWQARSGEAAASGPSFQHQENQMPSLHPDALAGKMRAGSSEEDLTGLLLKRLEVGAPKVADDKAADDMEVGAPKVADDKAANDMEVGAPKVADDKAADDMEVGAPKVADDKAADELEHEWATPRSESGKTWTDSIDESARLRSRASDDSGVRLQGSQKTKRTNARQETVTQCTNWVWHHRGRPFQC